MNASTDVSRATWNQLLAAAQDLLEARADQMVTALEWESLKDAVAACGGTIPQELPPTE